MNKELLHKNIENYLVDLLIIITSYFITQIPVHGLAYISLLLVTFTILLISKKPPRNYFLVILYAFSIIIPVLGLAMIQGIFIDLFAENLSVLSSAIILFSVGLFIVFLISFPKKNKTYDIIQTYIIPVYFTVLILATSYVSEKYSNSLGVVLLIYIPLRFLMVYTIPVRWYQFILIPAALYVAFISSYNNSDSPIKAVSFGDQYIDADFAYSELEDFEDSKVIKVFLKPSYRMENIRRGNYYFVVSNVCGYWRIDKEKTIRYNKLNDQYGVIDSMNYARLFLKMKFARQYCLNKKIAKQSYSTSYFSEAEKYCDSARIKYKYHDFDQALKYTQIAEQKSKVQSEIYFYRALIYLKQNLPKDSICFNLQKAVELYNMDALDTCKKYCADYNQIKNKIKH